ncbi:MAG: alanine--glyoxylate aminotransferase family protein [Candidatus Saccharicenans sp.]|jgi:aspartate aminotransferase-like enzyme|nr:alanine--glyoxylate aminotransferase family protein [Candidatus Saccharicenans sp.]MDH7574127.1 alanine--glyoxylate aminotransferase family protein [Candidatus Saccharicenans sp.]
MIKKYYLLSPGPTPVPESVLSVAAEPIIHHRTPEFSKIFMEVTEGLKYVFGTKEDVYILAASGTGAMETAVINTLSPGDKVITINGGKFGERWGNICRAFGLDTKEIVLPWGEDFSPEQLAEEIKKNPGVKAIFTTLSETSTGAIFDIKGFGEVVAATEAILVVDGISGLGATACYMDDWKIDILVTGSQKSFMIPPGLAYLAFSPKAWKLVETSKLPKFYFDIKKYRKNLEKQTTPWTPAVSLIIQQKKALDIIKNMGLDNLLRHHQILGEATRAAVKAIGLELLAKKPGNILTAVKTPAGVDGNKLVKTMQSKYMAYISNAQEPHKGEFFRIAHLGYMGGFDIITALSALEMTLLDLGYDKFQAGASVAAAQKILREGWQ